MESGIQGWLNCTPPGLGGGAGFQPGRAWSALQGFFPEARARAQALAGGCQGIVVTVAPYETYLPGVWRALAARRAMPHFAALAPDLLACPRGWADLVTDLRDRFGVLPITLRVVPGPNHPALPDTALAMFQRLFAAGVRLPPRQAARLAAVHRRLPQAEPLAAFTPPQEASLARRFATELEAIAALPMVRVEAAAPLRAAA